MSKQVQKSEMTGSVLILQVKDQDLRTSNGPSPLLHNGKGVRPFLQHYKNLDSKSNLVFKNKNHCLLTYNVSLYRLKKKKPSFMKLE